MFSNYHVSDIIRASGWMLFLSTTGAMNTRWTLPVFQMATLFCKVGLSPTSIMLSVLCQYSYAGSFLYLISRLHCLAEAVSDAQCVVNRSCEDVSTCCHCHCVRPDAE